MSRHTIPSFRILACLLSILICLLTASCQKKTADNPNSIHETNVKRTDIAEYGNYVYAEFGKIYRYDRKDNTFLTACMDPECSGNCPVDCVMSYFAGIHEGRVYFCGWQQYTHKVLLAYQDIATGEVGALKTLEEIEDSGSQNTFIDGGYWYYKCNLLKSGGDATNPDDYEPYICRISMDGKKDEPIMRCEKSEILKMVANGKILLELDGKLDSIDVETGERTALFDYAANGYTGAATKFSYLNGKIYLLAGTNENEISAYSGRKCMHSYLIWIDINTAQTGRLIETPVTDFCLTDNAIYYAPFKLRQLYIPDDYQQKPGKVNECMFDETLYACDLDGNNIRAVYTNEKLYYSSCFTVIDNVLYGWIFDYNEEAHAFNQSSFFGAIEFETDNVIRTEKPV